MAYRCRDGSLSALPEQESVSGLGGLGRRIPGLISRPRGMRKPRTGHRPAPLYYGATSRVVDFGMTMLPDGRAVTGHYQLDGGRFPVTTPPEILAGVERLGDPDADAGLGLFGIKVSFKHPFGKKSLLGQVKKIKPLKVVGKVAPFVVGGIVGGALLKKGIGLLKKKPAPVTAPDLVPTDLGPPPQNVPMEAVVPGTTLPSQADLTAMAAAAAATPRAPAPAPFAPGGSAPPSATDDFITKMQAVLTARTPEPSGGAGGGAPSYQPAPSPPESPVAADQAPAVAAAEEAGMLGGMSPMMLAVAGAALVGVVLLSQKKGRR